MIKFITVHGKNLSVLFLKLKTKSCKTDSSEKKNKDNRSYTSTDIPAYKTAHTRPDAIELAIGSNLIPLVSADQGILFRIDTMNNYSTIETGFMIPHVRIRENTDLESYQYKILINGTEEGIFTLQPHKLMAFDRGDVAKQIKGTEFTEPSFGLKAVWIDIEAKQIAMERGYGVYDCPTIIAVHLNQVIRKHYPDLLHLQIVQNLINEITFDFPVISDCVNQSETLNISMIHRVLQNLLRERIHIGNIVTILETLLWHSQHTRDTALLTEHVRIALSRQICRSIVPSEDILPVIAVDAAIEKMIEDAIIDDPVFGKVARLTPEHRTKLIQAVSAACRFMKKQNKEPVVLVPFPIRRYFSSLVIEKYPDIRVLSHEEIIPQIETQILTTISWND